MAVKSFEMDRQMAFESGAAGAASAASQAATGAGGAAMLGAGAGVAAGLSMLVVMQSLSMRLFNCGTSA